MNCLNPIDVPVLIDYWLAALPKPQEETIEEHLFECEQCSTRLSELIALAEGIRNLAREGSLRLIVSDEFLKRARENGLQVREYAPPAGGGVQCTVTAQDDLLIGRLAASVGSAKRVDLCLCDGQGVELHRMPDIPAHSGTASVICQESITIAKALPDIKMIMRLVAVDDAGGESLLGEYTFNHTRSLPGPGGLPLM